MADPQTSSDLPPLANRRPSARRRAFLGCTVVYGGGTRSFPCVIRDTGARGARIGFDTGQSMPSHFWLINGRDRTAHKARLVWAALKEAGVEFESSYALHQLPPELSYLKRFAGRVG